MAINAAISVCSASNIIANAAILAWESNANQLVEIGINNNPRRAAIIGQCAHESVKFRTRFENLNYSGAGLWRVFGNRHFASLDEANSFHRQPERIANRVYSNRMGNGDSNSGDGWRYRGRGFLQLTGRTNYRTYGKVLGLDFEGRPELAAELENCWLIAAAFMARTKRSGSSLLSWADNGDVVMVTKGINGGVNGLADRKILTARASAALTGAASTAEWQALLLGAGFNPGPIDGLMGSKTQAAIDAASTHFGLNDGALLDKLRTIG